MSTTWTLPRDADLSDEERQAICKRAQQIIDQHYDDKKYVIVAPHINRPILDAIWSALREYLDQHARLRQP